jgi:hypothetical protein
MEQKRRVLLALPAEGHTLEQEIESMNGVLGAVVLEDAVGKARQVQVYTSHDSQKPSIHGKVIELLASRGQPVPSDQVMVFKLVGDRSSLPQQSRQRQGRPRIDRIALEVEGSDCRAKVSLVMNGVEAEGRGRSERSEYALRVTAAAALEAAQALIGAAGVLELKGASVVETLQRKMVIVLVNSSINGDRMVVGAAIVGDAPVHEATVRATMDAVNRQLELHAG